MSTDTANTAARGWAEAMNRLAAAAPGGYWRHGDGEAALNVTRAPLAQLNGVLDIALRPDAGHIAALAGMAAQEIPELPWSVQVRGEPGADVVRVAAVHGLTVRSQNPFLLMPLADAVMPPPRVPLRVRPVSGAEHDAYGAALAAGFGVPPQVFASLTSPAVLDAAGITAYLAEWEGVAVGTGLAIVSQGCLGVFNISTHPAHRRRGYARTMTERILRDGRAAGARTAYLHASEAGLRLYESMGFSVAEHWTTFTAG